MSDVTSAGLSSSSGGYFSHVSTTVIEIRLLLTLIRQVFYLQLYSVLHGVPRNVAIYAVRQTDRTRTIVYC